VSLLLFDTTFLIDADRSGDELDVVIDDDDDVAIAAVTVAELLVGVALSRGKSQRERKAFVDDVLAAIPLVDYDLSVAEAHGELLVAVRKQGRPRGAHDLMIAATARATHRTVVTADASAFADLPDVAVRTHR
jgi:tRNA(fMet)-specific endonuclease VapC